MTTEQLRIFISHAHDDSELVKALVQLLLIGCRLNPEQIFASSQPNTASILPSGDINAALLEELRRQEVAAVLVVTEAYQGSAWCTYEAGALWHSGSQRVLPVLGPGVGVSRLPEVFADRLAVHLDRDPDLDKFGELIATWAQIPLTPSRWNPPKHDFLMAISTPSSAGSKSHKKASPRESPAPKAARPEPLGPLRNQGSYTQDERLQLNRERFKAYLEWFVGKRPGATLDLADQYRPVVTVADSPGVEAIRELEAFARAAFNVVTMHTPDEVITIDPFNPAVQRMRRDGRYS